DRRGGRPPRHQPLKAGAARGHCALGRARRGAFCLMPGAPLESPAPPSVRVRENEYFDAALRRFKRACEKAGILTELRRREFYEKPTQERKRKKAAAIKRHMKRVSRDGARASR